MIARRRLLVLRRRPPLGERRFIPLAAPTSGERETKGADNADRREPATGPTIAGAENG
jgi:hypothetical protein